MLHTTQFPHNICSPIALVLHNPCFTQPLFSHSHYSTLPCPTYPLFHTTTITSHDPRKHIDSRSSQVLDTITMRLLFHMPLDTIWPTFHWKSYSPSPSSNFLGRFSNSLKPCRVMTFILQLDWNILYNRKGVFRRILFLMRTDLSLILLNITMLIA